MGTGGVCGRKGWEVKAPIKGASQKTGVYNVAQYRGAYHLHGKNWKIKFRLENQMVHVFPFGKFCKIRLVR